MTSSSDISSCARHAAKEDHIHINKAVSFRCIFGVILHLKLTVYVPDLLSFYVAVFYEIVFKAGL
jgi:hypothetical protein